MLSDLFTGNHPPYTVIQHINNQIYRSKNLIYEESKSTDLQAL